jgi:anaerobic selenocysteine-containing dehydrogenase
VTEARQRGAKLVVFDVRLSNTATHADHWISPQPGSEGAILLAIARELVASGRHNRAFVERWWNWREYMTRERSQPQASFEEFERAFVDLYRSFTFEFAAREAGVPEATLREVTDLVARAGTRLSTHNWRSAAAGNLGGWQVTRCLFLLNALMGAVATEGGVYPNAWNKFVPRPPHVPPHPPRWNELTWPREYPLALNELSFLLPQLLADGRGRLDVYFTRVYNPVWTNPDGFSWIEMLTDEAKVGLHVALTPTWSETAFFADYVLPMGHASERHDLHSYETHDAQWLGFRQPVLRAARRRLGESIDDTRQVNPGETWEENEFWIELSWRVDPDGSLGIRRHFESPSRPGTRIGVDEYYAWIFENSVPGLPERAAGEGLTPLEWMRRYGAYEVRRGIGAVHEEEVPEAELEDVRLDPFGRAYTRSPQPSGPNIVPQPAPDPDADGRRPAGLALDGVVRRGFPTPSGRLEFYSGTLAAWGWPEHAVPGYFRSHVHPAALEEGQVVLIPTFRLPVQIHTRSANSKWLDEIAHTNPLWINPLDATAWGGVRTGDLVRVDTEIGHFVLRAWVTEGIRPGVVGCSHHMGRWKPPTETSGQRPMMATVDLARVGSRWEMRRRTGAGPYASPDPDTSRVWWTDVGVHQNLTFAVQPDPVSGMHCWHQAVRVRRAGPGEAAGDIGVDVARSRAAYRRWMEMTRPADQVSPDGTRRPYWLLRPLRPGRDAYRLPQPADR